VTSYHNRFQAIVDDMEDLTTDLLVDLENELTVDGTKKGISINLFPNNSSITRNDISDNNVHYNRCDGDSAIHVQSESTLQYDRSDSDSPLIDQWHCHGKRSNITDKTARNQLIVVCTLCILFMIGETVG
jgi:hypothetical protein